MASRRTLDDVEEELVQDIRLPDGFVDNTIDHYDLAVLLALFFAGSITAHARNCTQTARAGLLSGGGLLAHLAHLAGVTDQQLKRSRLYLPYFSKSKWIEVARTLGFPGKVKSLHLGHFSPPLCFLPPSQ
ncbi:hypothetical protein BKA93DRAFT_473156 [Sparassis latifolia]